MTAEFPQNPSTTDLQQENRFSFVLSRTPDMVYYCQKAELPGLTLPEIEVHNLFSGMKFPSNKLVFQNTSLTFRVNEDLANWKEIYNWMAGLGQPRTFGALAALQRNTNIGAGEYSDLVLTLRTPKGNSGSRIVFYRCFPTSLSGLTFETNISDVSFLTASVEFAYTTYDIQELC